MLTFCLCVCFIAFSAVICAKENITLPSCLQNLKSGLAWGFFNVQIPNKLDCVEQTIVVALS